jgi:hypothetical protein
MFFLMFCLGCCDADYCSSSIYCSPFVLLCVGSLEVMSRGNFQFSVFVCLVVWLLLDSGNYSQVNTA